MADILISKFTTQIPRVGATPATPGFAESEGQDPVAPSGTPQVYTPVTIGSPANGLSISGSQVLTIGLASTSTTGALSSTDWNTFNGKLNLNSPITGYTVGANTTLADTDTILQAFGKVQGQINARISGTIASGQVAFGTGVNTVGGDANMTYTTGRLTINRSADSRIIIQDNGSTNLTLQSISTGGRISGNSSVSLPIEIFNSGVLRWSFLGTGQLESNGAQTIRSSTGNLFLASNGGNGSIIISPNGTGGVGILVGTPTNTLDVNGTARIRTISNLGSAATSVLVPSATGVVSLRTLAELASDMGTVTLATGDARYLRKDVADTKAGNLTMSTGSLFMNAAGAQISYSTTSPGPASFIFNSTTRSGTFSLRQNNTVYLKNDVAGILYNAPIFMYNVAIDTTPASSNINFGILTNGDLLLNTTNGVKIGTATNQKLAFYNSTPIIQPSGDILTALSNLGLIASPTITQVDQFAVKTTASADQTLPSGTLTILDYDSTLLNNSTATYTVGTDGRITINITGVYTITAGVVIEADAVTALESAFLGIFRNGDLVAISSINTTIAAGAQSGLSTSTILSLTATDIIDCRALVNSVGGVANGLARRLGTLLGANATQVNSLSITKNSM